MPTVCYRALFEPADDGGYGVIFPEVPGCTSGGATLDEAIRNAPVGLAGHLGLLIDDGDPLPEPAPLDAPLPDWLLDADDGVDAAKFARRLVPFEAPAGALGGKLLSATA
jgi:predicted RNase H-like HicB family nuclease